MPIPSLAIALVVAALAPAARGDVADPVTPAGKPYCSGAYADDLLALSEAARAQDARQPPYTFAIRNSATYECPSYRADGTLRKVRKKVVEHGTGFGLRAQGADTLVVTNEHVAEWPAVTDEENAVEGVPAGCRRVTTALRVVDDESDAYERDDVALARVVVDPALDVAVLRAPGALPTLPWKLGRSAALRERNVVDVRGFPLGALRTNNVGKVVSTGRHDEDHGWDHQDFVVDALLSPGGSGSPVLAVSCETGELELVGLYHARYTRGSALHTVVGVDELRELLTTLKRAPRRRDDGGADAAARGRLVASVAGDPQPFFPFGGLIAGVRARGDGALVFELLARDFPFQPGPVLVLEDLPARDGGVGRLGRAWAGNRQGLREVEESALDKDARAQLGRTLEALRKVALAAADAREAARTGLANREAFQRLKQRDRALRLAASGHQDLAQAALELSEQLCPRSADAPASLADALATPPVPELEEAKERWRPVALDAGAERAAGGGTVSIPAAPDRAN